MRARPPLRALLRLPPTAIALARARLDVSLLSEAAILRRLRPTQQAQTGGRPLSRSDQVWLESTAWALQALARRLPWRTDCLVRTLAAEALVRRRGIQPSIHLQAGLPGGVFRAHTWLSCGGVLLSGGPAADLADLF